jgi:hypothetical protein
MQYGWSDSAVHIVGGEKSVTSQKQLEANRANAKRSTGPTSDSGKARSKVNSLKHGLTARAIVIAGEDPDQFDALRGGLETDYDPKTTIERELIDRLAVSLWRLGRVPVFEAALIKALHAEIRGPDPIIADQKRREWFEERADAFRQHCDPARSRSAESLALIEELDQRNQAELAKRIEESEKRGSDIGLALIRDSEKHDALGKLSRYETGLMNAVTRTLSLLHVLQASRQRVVEAVALPPRGPNAASQ